MTYKMTEECALLIPTGIVMAAIVHQLTKLPFDIGLLMLNTPLLLILGVALSFCISTLFSNQTLCYAVNLAAYLGLWLTSGSFVRVATMPSYIAWYGSCQVI